METVQATLKRVQGILNQFNLSEDQEMHVADTIEKLSSEIA